ncbi:flagellar motor protein MotB [Sulfuricaulis limicola]|uniref:Flagellar motor protein MotB n=1 Tax=Sulfuricaulis limicola TaxID=1620215 RepID=A0A1B4XCG8_9GAMM|nr:outer membrane beta-barrel protein [Sulfuricaulis limicola]BAV32482.1 flagellar motor protein MotB [Sulfuricaulis limicola]
MRMQYIARAAIACVAMTLSFAATAASSDDWYAGVGFGQSENKTRVAKIAGTGFTGSLDNEDSSWKAFGGYRLWDQYVAVEASYIDLGKTTASSSTLSGTQEIKAFTIGVVGYIPIVDPFGAIIHLGFSRNDSRTETVTGSTGTFSGATDFEFYWGAGLQFDITKNIGVRAELERFSVNGGDVNLRSAGVYYRF